MLQYRLCDCLVLLFKLFPMVQVSGESVKRFPRKSLVGPELTLKGPRNGPIHFCWRPSVAGRFLDSVEVLAALAKRSILNVPAKSGRNLKIVRSGRSLARLKALVEGLPTGMVPGPGAQRFKSYRPFFGGNCHKRQLKLVALGIFCVRRCAFTVAFERSRFQGNRPSGCGENVDLFLMGYNHIRK
jgi:hypothetical protein